MRIGIDGWYIQDTFYSVDPRKISVTSEAAAPVFRPVAEEQTQVVRERYASSLPEVAGIGDYLHQDRKFTCKSIHPCVE